ncbi:MAG: hypothetical protein LBU89_11430 [Fibromonadaceae bacterium]|nr:hypothetical protein [Fibromonadaceae bacterium]
MNKNRLFFIQLALVILAIWTWTCSEHKPIDWSSDEWRQVFVSSSSEELSSSSEGQSSSSSEEAGSSSSGDERSSSSEEEMSSSSEEAGSSSSEEEGSSSSEEEISSSSSSLPLCNGAEYNTSEEFCHSNKLYDKCGDADGVGKHEYNPDNQFCHNNYTVNKCGGQTFTPPQQRCNLGNVETRCGSDNWHDATTHFCQGGNMVLLLCGTDKKPYTIDEFCATNDEVLDRCNSSTYNPLTTGCCNNTTYSLVTHFCHNNQTHTCGNKPHNPATHFCHSSELYSCNNLPYNPNTHSCHGNQTYSCNNLPYDPNTHFCSKGNVEKIVPRCGGTAAYNGKTHFCHENTVYAKCDGSNYDPGTHFCSKGNTEKIVPRCGGTATYNGKTHFCHENTVYAKCGGTIEYTPGAEACCGNGKYTIATHSCHDNQTYSCGNLPYNPETQFCFNDIKIGAKCGINPQTYYNPNLYTCKPNINPNGIFLINPVSYSGESYEAVLIGTQTWMARNLNYNAAGSRCAAFDNCAGEYGRLYDWATAMNFDAASCNSSSCASQITTKHQGVCPAGWHLPSNDERAELMNFVGGASTAATKLRAKGGWSTGGSGYIPGTDDYGFSALQSGYYIGSAFYSGACNLWNAAENNASYAFYWNMYHSYAYVTIRGGPKDYLFSVRCLQD